MSQALDSEQQELVAPLLLQTEADADSNGMPVSFHSGRGGYRDSSMMDPNGLVSRLLSIPCAADKLPSPFSAIVSNGKLAVAAVLGGYLVLLGFTLPVYLLSMVVTEWGVYVIFVGTIFLIGRGIIRMIAFPGASRKVTADIEGEFAKYTIRMIESAASCIVDVANALCVEEIHSGSYQQLPSLWQRVQSFRNRVLGVLLEVLVYMQNNSTNSLELSAGATESIGINFSQFGNNPIAGDIGSFASLPVG